MEGNLNDLGLGRLFRKISVMEPMEERSAKLDFIKISNLWAGLRFCRSALLSNTQKALSPIPSTKKSNK